MSAAAPALVKAAPPSLSRFYRPELDQLRFSAFFLVFLHHALPHDSAAYRGLPAIAAQVLAALGRGGAYGVDLFFALSAYLITALLLREQQSNGTIDIRALYIRRALRIWPLYFFTLFVLAPFDGMPATYIAAYALLGGNWMCAAYGFPASSFALLWSVTIEEQFYLVWPWLVRHKRSITALMAIAVVTRIVLTLAGTKHPGLWTNTFTRLDAFAAGAWLAWWTHDRVIAVARWQRWSMLVAGTTALLLAGAFGRRDGWGASLYYPLTAASCAAIIYASLDLPCRSRSLCYLGKISFGLYVFHEAALNLMQSSMLGLALTIACAALSYRFLESPFLRWKERFTRVASRPV